MKIKISFLLIFLYAFLLSHSQTLNENFLIAVYDNDELKIFDLMRKGADVNAKTNKGVTPIMYSVQNGNYMITKKLLDAGAEVNYQSKLSPPPLINALINNDTAIAYLLLEYGANPNIVENLEKKYPLLFAIDQNNYVLSDLLLWYGANPNLSSDDITPLFYAIDYNADTSIVNLLIENGADINAVNKNGFSPLIETVFYDNTDIAKILLAKNADTQIRDKTSENFNAIDYAYKYHLEDMTKLLLPYYTNDAKKYHTKALMNNYLIGAKQIRQITDKKYYSPVISNILISQTTMFSIDDFYLGGKIGFKEARYNFDTHIGVLPRLFRKRILIEQSPNNYLQLWEKRTILFFELVKNFNIVYSDENVSGIYFNAVANFSFGDYKGINIEYLRPFAPSVGAGIWTRKSFMKYSLAYEYLPIQTSFPHFIKLQFSFVIPFNFGTSWYNLYLND